MERERMELVLGKLLVSLDHLPQAQIRLNIIGLLLEVPHSSHNIRESVKLVGATVSHTSHTRTHTNTHSTRTQHIIYLCYVDELCVWVVE